MKRIALIGLLLVLVSPGLTLAQQPAGQHSHPQKGEMKSMDHHMQMDEMMKKCSDHHQAMRKSMDQMGKTMESAKQSNDSSKLRAAIDETQKQLTEMKEHMAMCGNMMSMMQKMHGGMMKEHHK